MAEKNVFFACERKKSANRKKKLLALQQCIGLVQQDVKPFVNIHVQIFLLFKYILESIFCNTGQKAKKKFKV